MELVAATVDGEGKMSSVDDVEMNQALVDSEPLEIELDCTNREGLSIEEYMKSIIAKHPLLVVSKRSCPFCLEMRHTLQSFSARYAVVQLNDLPHEAMQAAQDFLFDTCKQRTVPNLFVNGKSHGGCSDMKAREFNGELLPLIAPFLVLGGRRDLTIGGGRVRSTALFSFPDAVNRHGVRASALITFVIGVFCCAYYEAPSVRWVMLATFVDFLLRGLLGPQLSPVGSLATLFVARLPPVFVAGPPKQFAVFCGVFFSGLATLLWFCEAPVGALVVTANLVFAASLEWAFEICLGCNVYMKLIDVGLLSGHVYRPFVSLVNHKKWAYRYHYEMPPEKKNPPHVRIHLPQQTRDSPVDLVRKDRSDSDFKQQDHSFVRHCRIDVFALPATLLLQAYLLKQAAQDVDRGAGRAPLEGWRTRTLYHVLFWAALGAYLLLSALYATKLVRHPQKVAKEWQHPLTGHWFAAWIVCLVMVGLCVLDRRPAAGIAIVWVGAVAQLALLVLRLCDLVYVRVIEEFHKPALMMTPVSLFLCAMGFAAYAAGDLPPRPQQDAVNYLHVSRVFFGAAAFFGFTFFVVSFRHALLDHHSDDRTRFTLWVWLAATASFGQGYFAVSGFDRAVGTGVVFQSMFAVSLVLQSVLCLGWARGFFAMVKDMAVWVMAFALSVQALYALQYYHLTADAAARVLAYVCVALAFAASALCAVQTATWLADGSLFKPRYKWGPVQFMKFQHELFYHAIPVLGRTLQGLAPAHLSALEQFCHELEGLLTTFVQHGRLADDLMFVANRRFFPNLNPAMDAAHHFEHVLADEMLAAVRAFRAAPRSAAQGEALLAVLRRVYPAWGAHVVEHSRDEEATVLVSSRKYVPLETMTRLAAAAYASTPVEEMNVVLPFVVKHLPHPEWKVRYVRCYLWGNPAVAQEIGLCLFRHCDDVLWAFLSERMPEIIPRGLPGYRKLY